MRSKYYTLLMAIFGTAAFGHACAAAPSSALKLMGAMAAPNCTVAMTDDGEFKLGKISPTQIKPDTGHTSLPPMEKDLTITCDADTYLTFSVVDNENSSASVASASYFGMGSVNTTGKLGYYSVVMSDATVSVGGGPQTAARVFVTNNGTFSPAATALLGGAGYIQGWADASKEEMIAAKLFKAKLTVKPELANAKIMSGAISDETAIAGSLTLNFRFGL
ncbi:DUF1120 domain-containing protein [Dyella sp.]|uniref:DUF1120 domain-containing protein n=1 Tax=Dyella sp. TaxID=1869338 RepID=UPI002ED3DF6E